MGVGVRPEALADAAPRIAPTTLAADRRLDVAPALGHVLPDGLQRGSVVGVRGPAATSLALAVAAGPVAAGSWLATVGADELCPVAAEQAGVTLHRLVMVAQPPRSSWGAVVAALVDAFDIVLVSGSYRARARDARRLRSRARERGCVLVDAGGVWPEAPDLVLEVGHQRWSGLGDGHGVLAGRRIEIEVSGRRGTRPRRVQLWLPGPAGRPEAIAPEPLAHAGADIDQLVGADPAGESAALPRAG